jgi:hypothetical protein
MQHAWTGMWKYNLLVNKKNRITWQGSGLVHVEQHIYCNMY